MKNKATLRYCERKRERDKENEREKKRRDRQRGQTKLGQVT